MSRRSPSHWSAIFIAVLMIVQYGVMPLLHAEAHRDHPGKASHGKAALSEEGCAFAKVSQAPVHFDGVVAFVVAAPVFWLSKPTTLPFALVPTGVGSASSRSPPRSA